MPVKNDMSKRFTFYEGNQDIDQQIANISYKPYGNKKVDESTIDKFLDKETKTTAFLVIRNDSILYERYWHKFSQSRQHTSFSIAKSFTSALTGIAIQEGFIKSVHDPVTTYIPELREVEGYWNELTVEHLLNMRSGISFDEEDYVRPFSDIASLYNSKNVLKNITKAKFVCKPNTCKYYSSLDTQILGLIIERATKVGLYDYLETKIWKPLGMEYEASWSLDSKKNQNTKAFCCIQATARDFAKFGRLYLNGGNWNGTQIIDEEWVNHSVIPDGANNCYQYQWYSGNNWAMRYLNEEGKYDVKIFQDSLSAAKEIRHESQFVSRAFRDPNKWLIKNCGPDFYALGIFGQEIYVQPEKNIIFVRLGQRWDTNYSNIFNAISHELSKT